MPNNQMGKAAPGNTAEPIECEEIMAGRITNRVAVYLDDDSFREAKFIIGWLACGQAEYCRTAFDLLAHTIQGAFKVDPSVRLTLDELRAHLGLEK